jgi:hypothetical protein
MPELDEPIGLDGMRFPFTFMGLLSVAMGAWIGAYALSHPSRDGVTVGLEVVPAVLFVAFGGWVLYRRLVHGRAA